MKALKVDFAIKRPIGAWPWVLLILALGSFAAYQGSRAGVQQPRVLALQEERASLTQQLDRASQARRDGVARSNVVPVYASDAAAVAKVAGFPVDRVLLSLESAQVQGVKVTGLEISASEGSARVELEFADHTALLAYLEAINAGEPKPRWVLLQAQVGAVAGVGSTGVIVSNWAAEMR